MKETRPRYKQNSDYTGPLVKCFIKHPVTGNEMEAAAYIIRVYQKNLVVVKLLDSQLSPESNGYVLIRAGVVWKPFLGEILKHYNKGARVPPGFQPTKRLPPDLLASALKLKSHNWLSVFSNLRKSGFLPPLYAFSKTSCPVELSWNSISMFFHDFKGTAIECAAID